MANPQFHIEDYGDFNHALQVANKVIMQADNYLELLPQLKNLEYDYGSNFDAIEAEFAINSLMAKIASKRKLTAQEQPQMQFDFIQEMIERLGDSLESITFVNEDLDKCLSSIGKLTQQETAYPLPDTKAAQKREHMNKPDTSHRAYLDYCRDKEEHSPAYRRLRHPSYDDWRDRLLSKWEASQEVRDDKKKAFTVANPHGLMKVRRSAQKLSFAKHEVEDMKKSADFHYVPGPMDQNQKTLDLVNAPIEEAVREAIKNITLSSVESSGNPSYGFGAPGISSVRRYLKNSGRLDFTGLSQAWKKVTGLE